METGPARPRTPDLGTRPLEMMALVLGFLLLVAAQWFPWFSVDVARKVSTAWLPQILQHGDIGMTDAVGGLRILYFIGITAVLTMCVVTAFGSPAVRRACAPVALGVLAGQTLIVVAVLHSRGVPTAQSLNLPDGVTITRASGAYAVLVALVFFAAAIGPALRAYGPMPTAQNLQESIGRLAGRVPYDADRADEDLRRPSEIEVDDRSESLPTDWVETPSIVDHGQYRRPQIIASDAAYRR